MGAERRAVCGVHAEVAWRALAVGTLISERLGFDSEQDWMEFREKSALVPLQREIKALLTQLEISAREKLKMSG